MPQGFQAKMSASLLKGDLDVPAEHVPDPIEMLWRHFRWEVTHCELFETKSALFLAAQACFERFNQCPQKILSVIGSHAAEIA